jgi:hypothetical protein
MTRFWRVFVVGAVLFALSSVLCLLMVGVIEQWISVPTSLVLGGAFGGAMGGIGSAFARKRLGGLRSVAAALAMSAVGLAAGLALSLLLDFWISMPLPRGRWSPMENQPPKRPIAFLGESSDVSPRPGDSLGLYVQTADGTVYRCEGRAWTGSCTWSEERTPDRPTTILGAGSYGLEAPPLLRRTLSRQSVFTGGGRAYGKPSTLRSRKMGPSGSATLAAMICLGQAAS